MWLALCGSSGGTTGATPCLDPNTRGLPADLARRLGLGEKKTRGAALDQNGHIDEKELRYEVTHPEGARVRAGPEGGTALLHPQVPWLPAGEIVGVVEVRGRRARIRIGSPFVEGWASLETGDGVPIMVLDEHDGPMQEGLTKPDGLDEIVARAEAQIVQAGAEAQSNHVAQALARGASFSTQNLHAMVSSGSWVSLPRMMGPPAAPALESLGQFRPMEPGTEGETLDWPSYADAEGGEVPPEQPQPLAPPLAPPLGDEPGGLLLPNGPGPQPLSGSLGAFRPIEAGEETRTITPTASPEKEPSPPQENVTSSNEIDGAAKEDAKPAALSEATPSAAELASAPEGGRPRVPSLVLTSSGEIAAGLTPPPGLYVPPPGTLPIQPGVTLGTYYTGGYVVVSEKWHNPVPLSSNELTSSLGALHPVTTYTAQGQLSVSPPKNPQAATSAEQDADNSGYNSPDAAAGCNSGPPSSCGQLEGRPLLGEETALNLKEALEKTREAVKARAAKARGVDLAKISLSWEPGRRLDQ